MTNTICGHDRDAVRFFCGISDLALRMNASVDPLHDPTRAQATAAALRNPAKLAEMMAEELRSRGLDAGSYVGPWQWDGTYQTEWAIMPKWPDKRTITIKEFTLLRGGEYTMPQARAILLRLLQLPADALTDDVRAALEAK